MTRNVEHKPPFPPDVAARFWAHVDRQASSGCWNWLACCNKKGYGVFGVAGRTLRAHRVAYALLCGPIPRAACLLHSCDNPRCVNPGHLHPGTRRENNAEMIQRGRHVPGGTHCGTGGKYPKGELHHASKLTADTVRSLRKDRERGLSFSKLASKYSLAIGHVFRIVNRKAWKHVA